MAPRAVQQRQCSRRPQSTGKHAKKGNESKQKEKHATHTYHPLPSSPDHALRSRPFSCISHNKACPCVLRRPPMPAPDSRCHPEPQPDRIGQDRHKIVRCISHCSVSGLHPHPRGKVRDPSGTASSLIGPGAASPNPLDFGTWDSPCLATCLSVPTCLPACRPTERTSRGLHSPRLGDAVTRSRRKGKKRDGLVGGREHNNAEKGDAGAEIIIPVRRCRGRGGGGPGSRSPPSPESDQTKRLLLPAGLAMQDFFSKARLPW